MDIDIVTKKSVKCGMDMDFVIHENLKKYGVVMVHDDFTVKYTVQNSKNTVF